MTPRRPVLRYHGGKWRLAPWIVQHFPPHRTYVEPFGGAASVLLRKPRAYAEVYNDLDEEVVNLFRVLRSGQAPALIEAVRLTPFAREEFEVAYLPATDPVERARRLMVRAFMGFGGSATVNGKTGFRANAYASNTHPAIDWAGMPDVLPAAVARLRGVVIENRPAIGVMREHDAADTLHYVDPPYLHGTRSSKRTKGEHSHGYAHEMDDDQHVELLATLRDLRGMVVLSGYGSELYDDGLPGWRKVERLSRDTRAQQRREALWLNPAVCAAGFAGLDLDPAA